jgi:hypothetical protein
MLTNDDGPLRDQPFVVEGLGAPLEGVTDGEGRATFEVPVHVREVTVFLPERGLRFQIVVGSLDPITEPSGVYARLVNLGYAHGGGTPSAVDQRHAVAAFQQRPRTPRHRRGRRRHPTAARRSPRHLKPVHAQPIREGSSWLPHRAACLPAIRRPPTR